MPIPKLPLLARLALTLAAAALLPLAISYYQLRTNRDALLEQVQRTHLVASSTAAERIDAHLGALLGLARALASNSVVFDGPRSSEAQEIYRGTLQAWPEVAAIGIYNAAGEEVVLAQRRDLRQEIAAFLSEWGTLGVTLEQGAERPWLRIAESLPEEIGRLVLVAEGDSLAAMLMPQELGEEADLALVSQSGEVLVGGLILSDFPSSIIEAARSGRLGTGVHREDPAAGEALIVGHAQLVSAPWFVLSRQPGRIAEVAQQRIRQATWVAAGGAAVVIALLSLSAWTTVIRPLRELIQAQRQLAQAEALPTAGSEIDQLRASFDLLQQRVRDSEDLSKVLLRPYPPPEIAGSGAMGTVFRGWDPKLKRPVALKTIRLDSKEFDQQKLVKNLLDEAVTIARFHHTNIVTVYDVADEERAAFIAMEFVDGYNLEAYLARHGSLDAEAVIPLGLAITRALAAAHEHGLVHHDVKPANVLLGHDGSIKVTDFGISKLFSMASKNPDVICGTPGYLAPECLQGDAYTPASDLFSLGVLLYECLIGRNPFGARNSRQILLNTLRLEPGPIHHKLPGIEPGLEMVIVSLLAKDPSARPPNAQAVVETFEQMATERSLSWTFIKPAEESAKSKPYQHAPTRLLSVKDS